MSSSLKYLWQGTHKIATKDKATGNILEESIITIYEKSENGQAIVHLDRSGIFNDKEFSSYISSSSFLYTENKLIPIEISQTYKDKNGKIVKTINRNYDLDQKKAIYMTNGDKKELKFEENLVDPEIFLIFLMNYPFEQRQNLSFHIISPMITVQKVCIEYKGVDVLNIGDQNIDCYKLQMMPDLGFMGVMAKFMPSTYFWVTVSDPHVFVRYEGPESGPKSSVVVREVIN